jgi:hypothetical protein
MTKKENLMNHDFESAPKVTIESKNIPEFIEKYQKIQDLDIKDKNLNVNQRACVNLALLKAKLAFNQKEDLILLKGTYFAIFNL